MLDEHLQMVTPNILVTLITSGKSKCFTAVVTSLINKIHLCGSGADVGVVSGLTSGFTVA